MPCRCGICNRCKRAAKKDRKQKPVFTQDELDQDERYDNEECEWDMSEERRRSTLGLYEDGY